MAPGITTKSVIDFEYYAVRTTRTASGSFTTRYLLSVNQVPDRQTIQQIGQPSSSSSIEFETVVCFDKTAYRTVPGIRDLIIRRLYASQPQRGEVLLRLQIVERGPGNPAVRTLYNLHPNPPGLAGASTVLNGPGWVLRRQGFVNSIPDKASIAEILKK